jgi:cytochrome P450
MMPSQWLIHRHPGYLEEPDQFRPERFLPGRAGNRPCDERLTATDSAEAEAELLRWYGQRVNRQLAGVRIHCSFWSRF